MSIFVQIRRRKSARRVVAMCCQLVWRLVFEIGPNDLFVFKCHRNTYVEKLPRSVNLYRAVKSFREFSKKLLYEFTSLGNNNYRKSRFQNKLTYIYT